MSTVSTHVLDTALGSPAKGVRVTLERDHSLIGSGVTDEDGRVRDLLERGSSLGEGEYKLTFSVGEYFAASKTPTFYTKIVITFLVEGGGGHYHVPLLVSPYGYSTYRGS
ncbi:MAG TPA: hydroxyisourate hydrolase [Gemmatimonadaceae bacterium]|nr:hydroxyisourate hydrolase [Gemmatimonadaceae bacterium]